MDLACRVRHGDRVSAIIIACNALAIVIRLSISPGTAEFPVNLVRVIRDENGARDNAGARTNLHHSVHSTEEDVEVSP